MRARPTTRQPPAAPLLALLLAACSPSSPAPGAAPPRAAIRAVGPAAIEILPAAGQPPFCLAFSVSEKGITRQLTMSPSNASIPCVAGEPIGATSYRIPPAEGAVRVHVIFSDRAIDATPIAGQVRELGKGPSFSAMDLRAPGRILLETLTFAPQGW